MIGHTIKKDHAGYYTLITETGDEYHIDEIERGHWEVTLNGNYWDTYSGYRVAVKWIRQNLEEEYLNSLKTMVKNI